MNLRIQDGNHEAYSERDAHEPQKGTPTHEKIRPTRKDTEKEPLQDYYEKDSGTQSGPKPSQS